MQSQATHNVFVHINMDAHIKDFGNRLAAYDILNKKVRFIVMDSERTKPLIKALQNLGCEYTLFHSFYPDEYEDLNSKLLYSRISYLCKNTDEFIFSTSLADGLPISSIIREYLLREKQVLTWIDTETPRNSDGSYGLFLSATDDADGLVKGRLSQLKEREEKLIVYTTSESYDDLVSENCDYLGIICVRLNYNFKISRHAQEHCDLVTDKVTEILNSKIQEVIIDSCRRSKDALKSQINFLFELNVPISSLTHYNIIKDDYVLNDSIKYIEWG